MSARSRLGGFAAPSKGSRGSYAVATVKTSSEGFHRNCYERCHCSFRVALEWRTENGALALD